MQPAQKNNRQCAIYPRPRVEDTSSASYYEPQRARLKARPKELKDKVLIAACLLMAPVATYVFLTWKGAEIDLFDEVQSAIEPRPLGTTLPSTVQRAELSDIQALTTPKAAEAILDAANSVYRHFHYDVYQGFKIVGQVPRESTPASFTKDFFDGGSCDASSRLITKLLAPVGLTASNFNIVQPSLRAASDLIPRNYFLRGHTVSTLNLERGAIIIDAMAGLIAITQEPKFDRDVLISGKYTLFTIASVRATNRDRLFRETWPFYQGLGEPEVFASPSGQEMQVRFPTIIIPNSRSVRLGDIDAPDDDIRDLFGGWANHVGYWYEPTQHTWAFKPDSAGYFEVIFHLTTDGLPTVLKTEFEPTIEVEGARIISKTTGASEAINAIRFVVDAADEFKISFRASVVSGRLVDAVVARKLDTIEWLTLKWNDPKPIESASASDD